MSERAALKDYEREHEREREHGTELAAGSRHVAASQQTQPQPRQWDRGHSGPGCPTPMQLLHTGGGSLHGSFATPCW